MAAAWLAVLLAAAPGAHAASPDYPDRPVRLVVVYPPGGGIDILARAMGQKLTDAWGAPIVVDNRPGAGTTLASAVVALGDVLAGQTQMYVGALVSALPHIRSGRLRALAITGKNRSNVLPELPTVAEQGFPGFDVSAWYGLLAPAGTPRPMIDTLHREVARIVHLPDVQQRLVADGAEPVGSTPDAFAEFLRSEIAKWGAAVKSAGAKVD